MKKELNQLINLHKCPCTDTKIYPNKEKHYYTLGLSLTRTQLRELKSLLDKAQENINKLLKIN